MRSNRVAKAIKRALSEVSIWIEFILVLVLLIALSPLLKDYEEEYE